MGIGGAACVGRGCDCRCDVWDGISWSGQRGDWAGDSRCECEVEGCDGGVAGVDFRGGYAFGIAVGWGSGRRADFEGASHGDVYGAESGATDFAEFGGGGFAARGEYWVACGAGGGDWEERGAME